MYCKLSPLNERDVIGVEIFLIKQGITKKKPKFKIIEDYGKLLDVRVDSNLDMYDRALIICYYIQYNFKAFRDWFKTYQL